MIHDALSLSKICTRTFSTSYHFELEQAKIDKLPINHDTIPVIKDFVRQLREEYEPIFSHHYWLDVADHYSYLILKATYDLKHPKTPEQLQSAKLRSLLSKQTVTNPVVGMRLHSRNWGLGVITSVDPNNVHSYTAKFGEKEYQLTTSAALISSKIPNV
ncbi:hypothetical protein [Lacticaseibacillus sharpeae]|uniref:hypothetical protein n=1 Tax=Lacticaseibacillus sharpeae TaxID=1626 RepID=UPI0007053D79|nr:hypothetical protein [Lacticaseibacillus sharpeae]